jgi:hypothetical protein
MSEQSAIGFLRRLIGHESATHESGRSDPGWCCSEHAFIASLAFALNGKKIFLCEGELVILKREAREG